jgi:hypothetical protein
MILFLKKTYKEAGDKVEGYLNGKKESMMELN